MALAFFSWIDYVIFTTITASGCIVGIYFGYYKMDDTVQNYLNGGKNLKWFPVSMSLVSSVLTGFSLIGYPTEVYMYGTQISVLVFSILISGCINYFVFLPVFFKLQLSSVYEYLELRYNIVLKNVFSLIFIFSTLLSLPILMYVPSLIFSQVSGVNVNVIAPIMILVCIFYTVVGGMKAVIWADTLQFFVTAFTLAIVISLGIISIGGFDVILDRIRAGDRWEFFNLSLDPTIRSTFWTGIIGHTFSWVGIYGIAASGVQRFVALSSMENVKKALMVFTVSIAAAKSICFLLGIIMYAKYYNCDPKTAGEIKKIDQMVPYFITEVTQGFKGLNGLFVAAFFGSAFSAFSTSLNTVVSVLYKDFLYSRISNKRLQEKHGIILKFITFIIGVSSIGMIYLIENIGTIFEVVHYSKGITGGATLGIFLLGLIVPFANIKGAITGGMVSITLMGVIVIGNQFYVWNGVIKQNLKPFHTYGCNLTNYPFLSSSAPLSVTTPSSIIKDNEDTLWLFRITFQYYFLIGTIITFFLGTFVSWVTQKTGDQQVNPDYISPFVHKISKKLRTKEVNLQTEAEPLNKTI